MEMVLVVMMERAVQTAQEDGQGRERQAHGNFNAPVVGTVSGRPRI